MNYKNFDELTYEEKVDFLEKEFGITEIELHNIEEVITQCHDIGYINNCYITTFSFCIYGLTPEYCRRIFQT